MAQFDNWLHPIIVNGKPILSSDQISIPAYAVRIWSRCRAKDRLFHMVDGLRHELKLLERANIQVSNQFEVERMK